MADLLRQRDWKRSLGANEPETIELSELLRAAPLHPESERDPTFRNVNSVKRKAADLLTHTPSYTGKPTRGGQNDRAVLARYFGDPEALRIAAAAVRETILTAGASVAEVEALYDEAPEGRLIMVQHARRERDPKLRAAKLSSVRAAGGQIACEVCGFDFESRYGDVGAGYIEVHHVRPLHDSGPTKTRLADLALLCANCHRMIHRARPWLTPRQLRDEYLGT